MKTTKEIVPFIDGFLEEMRLSNLYIAYITDFIRKKKNEENEEKEVRNLITHIKIILLHEKFAKELDNNRFQILPKGIEVLETGGYSKYLKYLKKMENLPLINNKILWITLAFSAFALVISVLSYLK